MSANKNARLRDAVDSLGNETAKPAAEVQGQAEYYGNLAVHLEKVLQDLHDIGKKPDGDLLNRLNALLTEARSLSRSGK